MRGRKDPRSNLPFKSISEPNPILHERRLILVTLAPRMDQLLAFDESCEPEGTASRAWDS